jgi:DNA-binding MarR family transcriptional regulator
MTDAKAADKFVRTSDFDRVCACHNIRKAARTITGVFEEALRPHGLRGTQFTLLIALGQAGAAPISRLSGALGMDRTTLSRELKPLCDAGLVSVAAGEDRRKRMAALTRQGREKLDAALPQWRQAQRKIVGKIGADDFGALLGILARLEP